MAAVDQFGDFNAPGQINIPTDSASREQTKPNGEISPQKTMDGPESLGSRV